MTEVQPPIDAVKDSSQDKQAATDAAKKMTAEAQSGFSITGAIESGMSHAVSFLEASLDYLPGLHLTGSAPAANQKAESKPPTATDAHPTTATDAHAANATDAHPALLCSTNAPGQSVMDKAFASVEHFDQSFSLTDYLKSSGFDTSAACKIDSPSTTPPSPPAAPVKLGGIDFTITSKASDTTNTGKVATIAETIMTRDQWKDVFATINSQTGKNDLNLSKWQDELPAEAATGDTTEVSDGTIVKTADGYVHKNAKGQVDFERRGDLDIKRNGDNTTSELNVTTHEMTLKDAHGNPMFVLGKDGFKGHTPDGTEVLISPDRKTATIKQLGVSSTFVINDGLFSSVINGTKVVSSSENALQQLGTVFGKADKLFDGKSGLMAFKDSKLIRGKDGTMFVGNEGTTALSLDEHSIVIRSPKDDISIVYNDGRPTVHLTKKQLDDMLAKHTKEYAVLAMVIQKLRAYGTTGRLDDGKGAVLKKEADGVSGTINHVSAKTKSGQTIFSNDLTHQSEAVDLTAKTVTLVGADGKDQGTLDFSGKTIGFKTAAYDYDNGTVTTPDGTVYGPQGIQFADGTKFLADGNITASNGTTYDGIGEAIAFENPAGDGTGGTNSDGDESRDKLQVSQAESLASSMLGAVGGGHATAGDIAALLSSFEKLSSLVGSLSQLSDTSLMASAVIAQGEVASSIDLAYDTLNRNIDTASQKTQNESIASTTTGAGGRILAMAGSNA